MTRPLTFLTAITLLPTIALATPILVPVDQANSSITVELCVAGRCDTDSSPVTGEAWIKVAPFSSPTSLTLYDFTFELTEVLDFYISWSFLGNLTATATDVTMLYATPFVPQPPTPVAPDGTFTYFGVPSISTGLVAYNAVGIPCYALQAAGRPCNDTMSLADQGTQTGDMNGIVTVAPGRAVSFRLDPNVSGPLDPNNPDLGTISMVGTVRGQVTVPLRGDADLDGTIDGRDAQDFVNVMLNPTTFGWQQRFTVDMNDDDAFDAADVALFIDCLLNANCPD